MSKKKRAAAKKRTTEEKDLQPKKFRRRVMITIDQYYETQEDGIAICVGQCWENAPRMLDLEECTDYYDCSTGEQLERPPRYRRQYIGCSPLKQVGKSKECCSGCGVNSKVAGICDGTNSAYCRDYWENHTEDCDKCSDT